MTATQALPNQASVPAPLHRTVQPRQAARLEVRLPLPLGVPGLALSVALHAGALLGGIHLLEGRAAGPEQRPLYLRFEESQASAASVPEPQPAPPATFASEVNEPPVPAREVTPEPERFETVLARMVPPAAPAQELLASELAPPKAGGFRKVDLLQKVRPEPVATEPVTEAEEAATPAVAAAEAAAIVLVPLAGHNPQPEYPALAWRHGIEGTTLLALAVDAAGSVTDVQLVTSSGSKLLDDAALRAARSWRFENGPGTVEVPFVFRMRQPRPD